MKRDSHVSKGGSQSSVKTGRKGRAGSLRVAKKRPMEDGQAASKPKKHRPSHHSKEPSSGGVTSGKGVKKKSVSGKRPVAVRKSGGSSLVRSAKQLWEKLRRCSLNYCTCVNMRCMTSCRHDLGKEERAGLMGKLLELVSSHIHEVQFQNSSNMLLPTLLHSIACPET